jgi:hypothetical protein
VQGSPSGNGRRVPPPPGSQPGLRHVQPPPLAALKDEFDRVLAANQDRLAEMQRQGMGMDPLSFVHARVDALIDFIAQAIPDGARWAVLCRLTFEQKIAAELEKAEPEGRRAILAQGSQFSPAMIAQLARETGMFRRRV